MYSSESVGYVGTTELRFGREESGASREPLRLARDAAMLRVSRPSVIAERDKLRVPA